MSRHYNLNFLFFNYLQNLLDIDLNVTHSENLYGNKVIFAIFANSEKESQIQKVLQKQPVKNELMLSNLFIRVQVEGKIFEIQKLRKFRN